MNVETKDDTQATCYGKPRAVGSHGLWEATDYGKLRTMGSYVPWEATYHGKPRAVGSHGLWKAMGCGHGKQKDYRCGVAWVRFVHLCGLVTPFSTRIFCGV